MRAQTNFKIVPQIAAINTVILIENKNNERSESPGEPVAKEITLIAKGDLEQEQLPIQDKSWSFVPCLRDLPGNAQSGFSKKTAWLTGHAGKRERDGALSWRECIGTIQRDSANMIKGLTPYQILDTLTSPTKKERSEVCWKKGSETTGQQLCQKIHNSVCREEPMFIGALQGHSGKNLDMSTFSRKKIEKRFAPFLYHIGFSRSEDSITSGELVLGSLGTSQGRKAVHFSLASPWIHAPTRSTSLASTRRTIMTECL